MSRIPRIRGASVLVAFMAALTAVLGLAVAPASAAAVTPLTVTALSKPTVLAGQTLQAAGTISMTIPAVVNGSTLLIAIDDHDAAANCTNGAADAISFSTAPAVSATVTSGTAPTFSTTLLSTTLCKTAAGSPKDLLTITFNAPAGPSTLVISGIKYNVGSAVLPGDVRVLINGAPVALASNATVVSVTATANNPPKAIGTSSASPGTAVSNIVFTELGPGAITGTVCATLTSKPAGVAFDTTNTTASPKPTVTASPASGDTVSGVTVLANTIQFTVTLATTPTTSTFTIAGVRLVTGLATGPVFVALFQCSSGAQLSNKAVVTSVTSTRRLGGADRFATAEIIAEAGPKPVCNALIARGDLFPDALAGNYLAGSPVVGGYAPILLTNTNLLPSFTVNALKNLGVKNVFILGREQAVSKAVADQLAAQQSTASGACFTGGILPTTGAGTLTVERIGGQDRYETAKLVGERPGLGAAGTVDIDGNTTANPVKTAIVATGENFPDALTGGPMAFAGTTGSNGDKAGFPLLLTNGASLNSNAAAGLVDLNIKQVLILGGTTAVSSAVETAIKAANGGIATFRLAGATRQDTAIAIATFERAAASGTGTVGTTTGPGLDWAFSGASKNHMNLARGDLFPDSLTGGPHAGNENAPIALTENPSTLGTPTTNYLHQEGVRTDGAALSSLDIFGGPDAITAAAATAASNAMTGA
jgi:ell wall binding domain 2 (CWB2)